MEFPPKVNATWSYSRQQRSRDSLTLNLWTALRWDSLLTEGDEK